VKHVRHVTRPVRYPTTLGILKVDWIIHSKDKKNIHIKQDQKKRTPGEAEIFETSECPSTYLRREDEARERGTVYPSELVQDGHGGEDPMTITDL